MKYCVFPRYVHGKLHAWYRFPMEHPGRYADRPLEVYGVGGIIGWHPSIMVSIRTVSDAVKNRSLIFITGDPLYNVEFKNETV